MEAPQELRAPFVALLRVLDLFTEMPDTFKHSHLLRMDKFKHHRVQTDQLHWLRIHPQTPINPVLGLM